MKKILSHRGDVLFSSRRELSPREILTAAIAENVSLLGAVLVGLDLRGLALPFGSDLSGVTFVRSDLAHAELNGVVLDRSFLMGADIRSASFRQASARHAFFDRCYASAADFREADLRDSGFEGADLSDARLRGARVRGTRFWRTSLIGATGFGGSHFNGSNTFLADLTPAVSIV